MNLQAKQTSLISELREYVTSLTIRCRVQRWFAPLLHVRVIDAIAADIETVHSESAQSAYSAEIDDLEAAKILAEISADGVVTSDEMPRLAQAIRFIKSSAARDHAISEALA